MSLTDYSASEKAYCAQHCTHRDKTIVRINIAVDGDDHDGDDDHIYLLMTTMMAQ
jgi:hypothetical protein